MFWVGLIGFYWIVAGFAMWHAPKEAPTPEPFAFLLSLALGWLIIPSMLLIRIIR